MFAAMQAIICTFIFVVFVSEAVTENRPAPCFLKETHERIRFNRAVSEDITKSFNPETLKKEANSVEKESPILIKSLNSGQIEKEGGSSSDNESLREKVTDSVKLILNPVNFAEEENSREKKSSKVNLTDSAQIRIKFSHNEKTESKENTSREKELQSANPTDSAQMIMKSLNLEIRKNEEGNWTERESLISDNSSNLENPKSDEKNVTSNETSIVTILDFDRTKNEEEKSIEKEAEFLNKSSISETTKEGNLMENNSLKANLTDFVQIALNSSETQQIKEENLTEKELENQNITDSEQIISKAVNYESEKIEEGKLKDRESTLKNLTVFSQKSSSKGKNPKVRRGLTADRISEKEKDEAGRAFLTAYEKCKLLKGKHFIRVSGPNVKETTKCVLRELQKLETYPNEFIKYLENKEIVRKA